MSSYREERRLDKAAEAAEERERLRLEREQAREDRREEREEKRREEEARRKQEQADRRAREQEQARKRAARAARFAKVGGWVRKNTVDVFVGGVMVAAVVPAVVSQVAALGDANVMLLLAVLLAAMLEGAAWAATFMGAAAEKSGRPTWKYRTATWLLASVAAAINYWHWQELLDGKHGWVPWVFGASSLLAVFLWDMRTHGSHGETREERKARRAKARQQRKRAKRFPDVWRRYQDLLLAHPLGTLNEKQAWEDAWTDVTGARLGDTAATLAHRARVTRTVEQALAAGERTPEREAVDALLADLFPAPGRGDDGPSATPSSGPSPAPSGGTPKAATALGGKGKQAVRGKSEGRPLEAADLEAVRALADELGDARKLSTRLVRKAVGCRTEYAGRLRDAVKAERGAL
ncbi:DUF2637 domain-containing protein [Streptomyces harbinensis]|uniref:DUF2637 domain-containing protein n=2 Tax=Bacteria TaxID=2 RepID=UPI00368C254D